jgi:hypothetical protein
MTSCAKLPTRAPVVYDCCMMGVLGLNIAGYLWMAQLSTPPVLTPVNINDRVVVPDALTPASTTTSTTTKDLQVPTQTQAAPMMEQAGTPSERLAQQHGLDPQAMPLLRLRIEVERLEAEHAHSIETGRAVTHVEDVERKLGDKRTVVDAVERIGLFRERQCADAKGQSTKPNWVRMTAGGPVALPPQQSVAAPVAGCDRLALIDNDIVQAVERRLEVRELLKRPFPFHQLDQRHKLEDELRALNERIKREQAAGLYLELGHD